LQRRALRNQNTQTMFTQRGMQVSSLWDSIYFITHRSGFFYVLACESLKITQYFKVFEEVFVTQHIANDYGIRVESKTQYFLKTINQITETNKNIFATI
jgi:hypothetical protein